MIALISTGLPHQSEHMQAFQEGLERHGIRACIHSDIPPADTVVCWGWRLGQLARSQGKKVLVMERGFINRMQWSSLGWNGLNGRAARNWTGDDLRLSVNHPGAIQAWNPRGDYALIVGQVQGDCAVKGIDLKQWYREAYDKALQFGLPIKFRRHPVAIEYGQKDCVGEEIYGDLHDALQGAAVVITYNSNTGVDSLLAGKPTIACDAGSMVWQLANRWEIQNEPDRQAWAAQLAWSQFSLNEMRSGFAWDVVKDSQAIH